MSDLKCLFSLLLYFLRNECTDGTICILISYVLTSFKEMSWPIKFVKGACPGLKRLAQITSDSATNAEKLVGPTETDIV